MIYLQPKTYNLRSNSGFAALTATIIIAAVLLILAVSVASSGFQSRFSVLDGELKEVSRGLAEGCVQIAMLEYERDNLYTGDNDIVVVDSVNGLECTVVSVSGPATALIIRSQAEVKGAHTNLEVKVDTTSNYDVTSWKEVAEFL